VTGAPGTWDLVVVGAGPAGATAALAALRERPDLRVLLLDRADFPRDKCCGDGVAPHVLDVLRPLGAADVVDGWEPVRDLGLSRGPREVTGTLTRPVWVVPRSVLDARIVEHAVAAGATLRRHRVRALEQRPDGVRVDDVVGRVVVGADGAHSVVRRHLGRGRPARRALAIRGYAPTPPHRRAGQLIRYGERRQPSYAWAFDRGDGWSNVGYGELVGDGTAPTRSLLLEQLELLLPGSASGGGDWLGHHLPLSGWGWGREQPDGPVLLAGDAAGLVNPMTGEGIYYAVATGALAGRAAARALAGGTPAGAGAGHRRAVRRRLDRHLHHTWTAARLSRHPAVVDAGIVAAGRDQRHFDSLVELGLGDGRITPRLAAGLAAGLIRS
jgi:geranylgeranyl reductase family protein